MRYSEIYNYALKIITKNGLSNNIVSSSDKAGVNIGHTIPEGFVTWTKQEKSILKKNSWQDILKLISTKRKFINSLETTKVTPGIMLTIEPRLIVTTKDTIPLASYHMTLHIGKNGEKRLISEYDTLFKLFGMEYML